jgi:hypothetical protein
MPPDDQTITLAAIGLAAAVALISPGGAYVIQERRIRHEQAVERDRKRDEATAADHAKLQALIDDALLAATRGMTYLES